MVSRSKPVLPSIHTHPAGGPQQWCNCHPRKGRILLVEGHLVVELTLKDNKCIPVQNHLSKDNVLTRKQIDLCTWRCITTQALTQNTALRSLTKGGNYLKNKNKKNLLISTGTSFVSQHKLLTEFHIQDVHSLINKFSV